ncbi:MAG: metallophosphoesterase [Bacteroidota bacterium]
MNRREFMKVGSLFAAGGLLAKVGQIEINDETNTPVLERVEIPVRNLHPALDGFTIVQLSDIHLQPFTKPDLVRRAVEMSNELRPDLVVLTGDYVWRDQDAAFELAPILAGLNARHGVYSVLGNHDLWLDAETTVRAFEEASLPMLVNQGVEIHQGKGAFYLAGMDDGWSGRPDLALSIEKAPAGVPIVLLLHEPDLVSETSRNPRIALQLSGHTHGGQVLIPGRPPIFTPILGKIYSQGLFKVNDTWLYTNRGLGVISVPLRFNCPPEVTLLTLTSA